jgi:hypothetical protein
VCRADFNDYDAFKEAHAHNGAAILRAILEKCGVAKSVTDEACRWVTRLAAIPVPICSRMRTVYPILRSICPCTTSAKAGRRPGAAAAGAIGVSRGG